MLYLAAIVLSFFLSFVLVTKKNKSTGDKILVAWLATIGIHLIFFYLFISGLYVQYPWLILPGFSLPLAHGPFLYTYTVHQLTPLRWKPSNLLHFLPPLFSLALFAEFFLLPPAVQLTVINSKGKGFEWQSTVNLAAIYVSGLAYISLSLLHLMNYKKRIVDRFSNTEKINFNWLLYLVAWLIAIWMSVIFVRSDEFTFGLVAVFTAWLGYFGIKQVQVFSQSKTGTAEGVDNNTESTAEPTKVTENLSGISRYQKSALAETAANDIHHRLVGLLEERHAYRNPDLSLTDLARSLSVHPNVLSQVINTKTQKTFYDLVNEKRVQEFIRLSADPRSRQYTLLSMAFDCGFNSKASFNRNFKKHTGQTPSEFMKHHQFLQGVNAPESGSSVIED